MGKILFVLAIVALVALPASAGTLIFEGNLERGEPPYPVGGGKVRIDVYAQGILNVAAVQSGFNFLQAESNFNALFQISKDEGNQKYQDFDYQMIDLGPSIPSGIFPVYTDQRDTAGFMLLSGSLDFAEKTLLYSVTYDYSAAAVGIYNIDVHPDLTSIGDPDANPILYDVVSGNIIIPEPITTILLTSGIFVFLSWRRKKI